MHISTEVVDASDMLGKGGLIVSIMRVYSAACVIPITAPSMLGGSVAVKDGRIEHVGDRQWLVDMLRERGVPFEETYFDGVLMPGLVNAHTHLQYTGMWQVGAGQYTDFPDWARAFDEVYDAGPQDWRAHAADGATQLLRAGTTAAADVVTDAEAASALHDAGLHGVAYWEVMGWSNEDWHDRGVRTVLDAVGAIPAPPGVGLSPHAPYSLEAAPLSELPDVARRQGLRLHIHLGESHVEAGETGARGELAVEWESHTAQSYTKLRADGAGFSSTQFVDQLGVLGPDCHIAHGVYMTADDRRRLRARHTAVALCPRSNRVIGLDEPPVAAYLQEGNLIAVGTDSLSSSPSLDLLEDVAALHDIATRQGYSHPDLSRRLLHAATLGGATAMGLSTGWERVGQLQSGAVADMVFIDVPVGGVTDAIEHVARFGARRQVATMISGELRWATPSFPRATESSSTQGELQ